MLPADSTPCPLALGPHRAVPVTAATTTAPAASTTSGAAERERRQADVERLKQPDDRARPGPLAHAFQAAHQVSVVSTGQRSQVPAPPVPPGLRQEDSA